MCDKPNVAGKCFVCGKDVKIVAASFFDGASETRLLAEYGSKYDGEEFYLLICDGCVEKNYKRIVKKRTYELLAPDNKGEWQKV